MLPRRIKLFATALTAATAAVFLFASAGSAGGVPGAQKLGGAWIAVVPGTPVQWSYVVVPDPSGRRASGHGTVEVSFSLEELFGPIDDSSPLLIEFKMTGPEKGTFNSVWYGLRDLPSGSPVNAEVVVIGVSKGRFEALAPGKNIVEHMFEFYLPSQDGDGDGLPDADETPVYGMQVTSIDTRLPSP